MKKESKQAIARGGGALLGLIAVAVADKLIGLEGLMNHQLHVVIVGVCVILGWFLGQKIASN